MPFRRRAYFSIGKRWPANKGQNENVGIEQFHESRWQEAGPILVHLRPARALREHAAGVRLTAAPRPTRRAGLPRARL